MQCHNTFDNDNRLGVHMNGFLLSVAFDIGISRLFYRLSVFQFLHVFSQKLPVESVWMVEIDGFTLFRCHDSRIIIIRINRYHCHTVRRKCLGNLSHDGGFARSCATCYSNNCHILLFYFFYNIYHCGEMIAIAIQPYTTGMGT